MKTKNQLQNLEKLSRSVYKLNYTDKTSEDFVYYQILKYLAEYGSFTITNLDRKFHIIKQVNGIDKKIRIERRKLKNILTGEDKDFVGLIPLGYVRAIPELKKRGGNQEYVYYPTEKGIMASIGFHSYKKNINLNKILEHYRVLQKRYKKFISEFIKLQIQTCLSYYYVQGLSHAFKKEHVSEYDRLRSRIIKPFEIRIEDIDLEKQFKNILNKFNKYRKIHWRLFNETEFLHFLWEESQYVRNGISLENGFHGWYQLQFLTDLDNNLKPIRHKFKKNHKPASPKSKNIRIRLVSEPTFLFSQFQDDADDIPNEFVEDEMKSLGIIRRKRRKRNSLTR